MDGDVLPQSSAAWETGHTTCEAAFTGANVINRRAGERQQHADAPRCKRLHHACHLKKNSASLLKRMGANRKGSKPA